MDPDSSLVGIGVGLCLLVLAFTSAVDAAFSAISRHRLNILQHEDAPRTKLIHNMFTDPYRFKAAILFLNAAAIIAATAFTLHLTRHITTWWRVGALCLLLLLMLIFSEALPKALATRNPSAAAQLLVRPMAAITTLLQPFIATVDFLTTPIIRLFSGQSVTHAPLVTEEELRLLVNVGEEEGLIEPNERNMIEGIFSFGDTLVREVMSPRVDIVALDVTASLNEAIEASVAHGHSRIPVYQETIDQIIGILHIKDLLPALRESQHNAQLVGLLRLPYFIPETMKVDALLKDLQTRKSHMAIVVDEYGGTAGVVTIEDLLEEIVGEIQDEYDVEEPSVQVISDGELLADARTSVDDINDLAGLHLSSEDSDRIGGLVYEQLGRVPTVGDEVHLPDGVTITVLSVEGLGPRRLRITYPPIAALAISTLQGDAGDDGHT